MEMVTKKYPLFGMLLALAGGMIFADRDKDYYLGLIDNTYNDVFGNKANLFEEKNFNETDEGSIYYKDALDWDALLYSEKKYIYDNAFKNQKLHNAFETCEDISKQLMNTLEAVYKSVFASGKLRLAALSMARNAIITLNGSKEDLEEKERILTNTTFLFNRQERKAAREVLIKLIGRLEDAINKLDRNFREKI